MKVGDKIHFDTTKEAELLAWMKTLEYDREGGTTHDMMYTHIEESGSSYKRDILSAHCLPGERFGIENDVYILRSDIVGLQDTDGAVYISEDLSSLSPALTQGFHTDANGDIAIVADGDHGITEYPVSVVIDTNPPAWNGVFAGVMEEPPASKFIDGVIYFYDGEEYHAVTGEGGEGTLDYNKLENIPIINLTENKTTVLLPFENGDILNGQSKIHFDTTKVDEFADYLNSLVYSEHMPMVPFFIGIEDQSSLRLIAAPSKSPEFNIPIFSVGLFGGSHIMVFAADDIYDAETGEKVYSKGFQNLDEDGNLLLDDISGDYVLELFSDQELNLDPADWNNIFISNVAEQTVLEPQPEDGEFYKRDGQIYKYTAAKPGEIEAFEVGDVFTEGTKIHFDTTKETELLAALHNLTWMSEDDISVALMIGVEGNQDAMIAYLISGVTYLVGLAPDNGKPTIVYASEAGEWEGLTFVAGFQNLDENGDIIYENERPITSIDDPNNEWNGIIIGIMGESQPELYDKVVLESELGGGSGAVVIDLGEITEQHGEIDLTEEQYNLIAGNPDVILRAKLNMGGDAINVYANKQAGMTNNDAEDEIICGVTLRDLNFNCIVRHSDNRYVCRYVATEDFVGPILYRHDIKILCSAPSVFTVYLTAIYYTNDAVDTITALGNMLNWHDNYMVNGYYNNSTALLPITCINMNSKTVSYLDGVNEQTASFDDSSKITITDSVTTLAK